MVDRVSEAAFETKDRQTESYALLSNICFNEYKKQIT